MLLTLDMSYFVTVRNNFSCFFSALSISIEIRVYVYAFGFVSRDKHRVRISTTCQLVFMVLFSCVFFFCKRMRESEMHVARITLAFNWNKINDLCVFILNNTSYSCSNISYGFAVVVVVYFACFSVICYLVLTCAHKSIQTHNIIQSEWRVHPNSI